MTGDISSSPEAIREIAKRIANYNNDQVTNIENYIQKIQSISDRWDDNAHQQLLQQVGKLLSDVKSHHDEIETFIKFLNKRADLLDTRKEGAAESMFDEGSLASNTVGGTNFGTASSTSSSSSQTSSSASSTSNASSSANTASNADSTAKKADDEKPKTKEEKKEQKKQAKEEARNAKKMHKNSNPSQDAKKSKKGKSGWTKNKK